MKLYILNISCMQPIGQTESQTAIHIFRIRKLETGNDRCCLILRTVVCFPTISTERASAIYFFNIHSLYNYIFHLPDIRVSNQQFLAGRSIFFKRKRFNIRSKYSSTIRYRNKERSACTTHY